MVKKEVISMHIGQAGVQMGTAFWELFLLEHGIGPDGYSTISHEYEDLTFESFFEDLDDNRYLPRTLFLDTEPNVIDELRTGVYGHLFHPDQTLAGVEDGANNFARGSFTLGNRHMLVMLERIRKSVEACQQPQGFMVNHSFSGGTGSGLTSVLLHALTVEYPKTSRIQVPIFPGPTLATAIVEPYNCTFHVHSAMDATDLAFLFDNEALYELVNKYLFVHSPTFTHINRFLALINSAITCSMRFEGTLNADLSDIQTNLIPYPRIHFPTVAHTPIMHQSRVSHNTVTVKRLVKDAFSPEFQTVRYNLNRGAYMAVMINARGLISPLELNDSIKEMKLKNILNFVEWCPTGFKICLNNQTPSIVPESFISHSDKSITMVCNSTAIKDCWISLSRKFDLLFEKRAFIHWFISEGMEESEFIESRFDLGLLCEDYHEISMTENEIEAAVAANQDRPSGGNSRKSGGGSVVNEVGYEGEYDGAGASDGQEMPQDMNMEEIEEDGDEMDDIADDFLSEMLNDL